MSRSSNFFASVRRSLKGNITQRAKKWDKGMARQEVMWKGEDTASPAKRLIQRPSVLNPQGLFVLFQRSVSLHLKATWSYRLFSLGWEGRV